MLIPNARHVALKSWSLWANRLGFASLVCPWVVFEVTGAGPDPVLFGWIGVAFYLLAEALRFIDQGGLDGRRDTFFSPAWVGLLALVAVLVTMGMGRWVNDPSPPEATLAQGPPSDAQVLDVAVPLVSKWEGLRTEAYLDTIANPPVCTICFGETDGIQCFPPETRTEAQCRAGLRRLLPKYGHGWYRYLTLDTMERRLTPDRAAAFWSFSYNVGVAGAGRSTATKRLNAGDVSGACDAMTWWNKAGGREIRGLVRRRNDEWGYCVRGL